MVPELVHVPVPVERLRDVYAVLAQDPSRPSISHQALEEGYPAGWSGALIDRMFVESSRGMRRILGAIAARSPSWVSTRDIADASGLTARQAIASLGPFEKRIRGRYGMNSWPFATREFVDQGILKYSMSPDTAKRVLELAAQVEEHEKGGEEWA